MKRLIFLGALCCPAAPTNGQTITRTELITRIDHKCTWTDGGYNDAASGFDGQYLRFRIDGTILPNVKFVYRQRFNKENKDGSFFDTVDYLKLTYDPDKRFFISFGKDDVLLGNFENDLSAYDVFYFSELFRKFSNKQFSLSLGTRLGTRGDRLELQVGQSPFARHELNTSGRKNLYAYGLRYTFDRKRIGLFYSLNAFECLPGRYVHYLCLGHKVHLPRTELELDYINRFNSFHGKFFSDCTLTANVTTEINSHLTAMAKYSYDLNRSLTTADYYVPFGTSMHNVSAGLACYPFKTKDLRAHAAVGYAFGTPVDDLTRRDKELNLNIGLTWRIDFYKIGKMIVEKRREKADKERGA